MIIGRAGAEGKPPGRKIGAARREGRGAISRRVLEVVRGLQYPRYGDPCPDGSIILPPERNQMEGPGQPNREGEGVREGVCGAGRPIMHPTVTAFLDHLRAERNASAHTIRSYEDDLSLFCRYLEETQRGAVDPLGADARRLRRYSA